MFGREFRAAEHRQHHVPSAPTGYGLEKVGYESLRTADSYQFGGGWSAKIVYENDDEGEYAEAILTGPGGVEEVIYPGDGRTFEPGELEDEARQLISEYGDSPYEDTYQYNSSHREASREATASHHLAFFDGFDLPEPRHRVAGWDWDDHLNGFIAAEAAREFTCSCGANVPAPGYTDCHCGKRWNAYTINANGSQKMIAREVPVRDGVVMAGRTASRAAAYEEDDGYTSPDPGDSIEVHSGGSYFEVLYDKRIGDHKFRATNGQEFYVTSIVSINGDRLDPEKIRLEASRKQAADYSNYSYDQLVDARDILRQQYADWEIDQSEYKNTLAEIEAEAESRGLNLASRKGRVMAGRTASRKTSDVNWYDQNGRQEAHFAGGEHITVFPDGRWEVSTGAFLDSGQAPSVEQAKAESLEALSYLAFGSRKQAGWEIKDGDETYTNGGFEAVVLERANDFAVTYWENGSKVSVDGKAYDKYDNLEDAKYQAQNTVDRWVEVDEGYPVASRRQASGIPAFQEGDMVIGRGPDMNTHTLREIGSVVEQDGGYFYRLRKLNGSGPGGQRLYAEEHLEGYRLQR